MIRIITRFATILLCALSLLACSTHSMSPRVMSELSQSKRYFDDGYYKKALRELLPLASEGHPQAQYAIGYMYYYGLGVAQDTDTGHFWVQKAAEKNYAPAIEALKLMVPGFSASVAPSQHTVEKTGYLLK